MRFLNRHPQYIIRWHVCSAHITPPESTQSTTFITSTHKKKKYEPWQKEIKKKHSSLRRHFDFVVFILHI